MMGRTPHVTRIGENTQGVFSAVSVYALRFIYLNFFA
jgi:hypothetical protein